MTIQNKLVPTVEQLAARYGVTVEQVQAMYRKNAEVLVKLTEDARKVEATGRKHRSGSSESLHASALHAFAMANGN